MIYVGVFVRLLIFTSWGGESIWWAGESWSFGALERSVRGRGRKAHLSATQYSCLYFLFPNSS